MAESFPVYEGLYLSRILCMAPHIAQLTDAFGWNTMSPNRLLPNGVRNVYHVE